MRIFWWKLRFVIIMMFSALVSWDMAWMIAESYVESLGTDDTPSEAVKNELDCWGE